jgi:threonine synthase
LYYYFAYQQWQQNESPVICVPSGNFGNICAGIVAYMSGLPVKHFIAACNANDTVPQFLQTGNYEVKPAVATISNAMDVANPSNFVRVLELFHQQVGDLTKVFSSVSIDDATTKATIKKVYDEDHYMLDPHGAVAFYALYEYQKQHENAKGFILETAHPVKFPDTVEEAINKKIAIPESVQYLLGKEKQSSKVEASFEALKEWLMNR